MSSKAYLENLARRFVGFDTASHTLRDSVTFVYSLIRRPEGRTLLPTRRYFALPPNGHVNTSKHVPRRNFFSKLRPHALHVTTQS